MYIQEIKPPVANSRSLKILFEAGRDALQFRIIVEPLMRRGLRLGGTPSNFLSLSTHLFAFSHEIITVVTRVVHKSSFTLTETWEAVCSSLEDSLLFASVFMSSCFRVRLCLIVMTDDRFWSGHSKPEGGNHSLETFSHYRC